MLKILLSLSILLSGLSGCASRSTDAHGEFYPVIAKREFKPTPKQVETIGKWYKDDPELIMAIKTASAANGRSIDIANKSAKQHNAKILRSFGAPEEQIKMMYGADGLLEPVEEKK